MAEARKETDPDSRADLLRRALALFRGEPLSDFRYEDFARAETDRVEALRLGALEECIDAELELGRHADLVAELERLVTANPLRERLRGELMLALYRSGRQADALQVYREGRRLLADELALEPGPALKRLEHQILSQDPALAPPSRDRPAPRPREERKLVTILFCDLIGFTAQAEQLDPEDVRALQRPYFERVRAEIERFGGTVEKFIGDAVMAAFGAPVAHEDDAERAVRAALAIRDALATAFELRIAVHSGEALVTLDAEPRTGEGIVTGDVVNTASRLQALAPTGGILVGEATYRVTRDAIEYREEEPVRAKGKAQPLAIWRAIAARTPARATAPRRLDTPLIGRGRELDQLMDAFERARAEREPQLVTVVGVPGIGKSRILLELRDALGENAVWRQGRSLPYGDGVTFWALGEVVKEEAGILESDSAEAAGQKLERAATEVVADPGEARWVARQLRPLLGLGGGRGRPRPRRGRGLRRLAAVPRGPRRARAAGTRARGSALGRRRPPRLRRRARRAGSRRAAPRGLHRAPRAARAEARMGRRQAERHLRLAPTTLRRARRPSSSSIYWRARLCPRGRRGSSSPGPKAIHSTPRSTPAWWSSGSRAPSCPRRRPCTG